MGLSWKAPTYSLQILLDLVSAQLHRKLQITRDCHCRSTDDVSRSFNTLVDYKSCSMLDEFMAVNNMMYPMGYVHLTESSWDRNLGNTEWQLNSSHSNRLINRIYYFLHWYKLISNVHITWLLLSSKWKIPLTKRADSFHNSLPVMQILQCCLLLLRQLRITLLIPSKWGATCDACCPDDSIHSVDL